MISFIPTRSQRDEAHDWPQVRPRRDEFNARWEFTTRRRIPPPTPLRALPRDPAARSHFATGCSWRSRWSPFPPPSSSPPPPPPPPSPAPPPRRLARARHGVHELADAPIEIAPRHVEAAAHEQHAVRPVERDELA